MSGATPYARELEIACELANQAGALLRELVTRRLKVDRKDHDEPVTEADRASEALIIEGLRGAFPADGILSEENDDRSSWTRCERAWLVDPVDGTKELIAGRRSYSVMIGLLLQGRPVLGVVHQPATGLTYRAARGAGATMIRDGQQSPLEPSAITDPARARLVASRSHRSERVTQVKTELGIEDELNVGSVGLKIGLVARGDRDLYVNPESRCKLWDICAPEAILIEAGGRMTDLVGDPLSYQAPGGDLGVRNGIIATNGACHDAVVAKIAPLFAGDR